MRILLVEDDDTISEDLCHCLASHGYVVQRSKDGEEAWFIGGTENFSAIILDLGLPGLDGLQVLRRWRDEGVVTPVLVLTARGSWMERVEGIETGADDYLAKPFKIEELLARLHAIIRRTGSAVSSTIRHGNLVLDNSNVSVKRDGVRLNVTPMEFRAISYLLHHRGRPVSQMELGEQIHGSGSELTGNAIEALIARLRRKVGQNVIKTKRGFGYFIEPPDDARHP
ncbi:MAG: response regulator transcription factor [Rhizobiales bacterium]|nr:response regulator transcription factor [Hyphomicrobiales bacterium]